MATSWAMKRLRLSTPSTLPRWLAGATSAVQALKAASLAVEPKKVIRQSSKTTIRIAIVTFLIRAEVGKSAVIKPQRMYPNRM